jgi:hypothetical protein
MTGLLFEFTPAGYVKSAADRSQTELDYQVVSGCWATRSQGRRIAHFIIAPDFFPVPEKHAKSVVAICPQAYPQKLWIVCAMPLFT